MRAARIGCSFRLIARTVAVATTLVAMIVCVRALGGGRGVEVVLISFVLRWAPFAVITSAH